MCRKVPWFTPLMCDTSASRIINQLGGADLRVMRDPSACGKSAFDRKDKVIALPIIAGSQVSVEQSASFDEHAF
jgi:hypothetical protein